MGKVKDEAPARGSSPAAVRSSGSRLAPVGSFLANLLSPAVYKPTQGQRARLGTALGLGLVVLAGLVTLYNNVIGDYPPASRFGIPAILAVLFGWIIWRIVQYPPFADFLTATEAEMNKVSWTSKDDLYRATVVVLTTVLLLSLFLFGVDVLWSRLLQLLRVLRFDGMTPPE